MTESPEKKNVIKNLDPSDFALTMSKPKKLIRFRKKASIRLECENDLDQLFEAEKERQGFEHKWNKFLSSNPYNSKIYSKKKNHLSYTSEQLIPRKKTTDLPYC